jgi:hypothetical protein
MLDPAAFFAPPLDSVVAASRANSNESKMPVMAASPRWVGVSSRRSPDGAWIERLKHRSRISLPLHPGYACWPMLKLETKVDLDRLIVEGVGWLSEAKPIVKCKP